MYHQTGMNFPGGTVRPTNLAGLGGEHAVDPELDNRIALRRRKLETMGNHPERPVVLNNLGMDLFKRGEIKGDERDVVEGLSVLHAAIDMTPHGHPNRAYFWSNLALGFMGRFERLEHMDDIERAISLLQWSVQATPPPHPSMPLRLGNLGMALHLRSEKTKNPQEMYQAISTLQSATGMLQNGDPRKPGILGALGLAYAQRFEKLNTLNDLKQAIAVLEYAVPLVPDEDPKKMAFLTELGQGLVRRFQRLGELDDLNRGISILQGVVNSTPDQHRKKPIRLKNLSNALARRFLRSEKREDIETSISNLQNALGLIRDGDPKMPIVVSGLGQALFVRYSRLGSMDDLEAGISMHQLAVELTSDADEDKPMFLNSLAQSLLGRYERLDTLEDIETSISALQKGLKLTESGTTNVPRLWNSLGYALFRQSERLGSSGILERSISTLQTGAEMTPNDDPDKSPYLSNLGMALCTRFERQKSREDLERAISAFENAVNLTHSGDRALPMWMNNLSYSLLLRFRHFDVEEDVERAVSCMQIAIESIQDGHSMKSMCLNLLGTAYMERYAGFGRKEDAEVGINTLRTALSLTPRDHPNQPVILFKIGRIHLTRFQITRQQQDLDQALETFLRAAKSPVGSPTQRFYAALQWAKCDKLLSRPPITAYRYALEFLPRIAWIGLSVGDQHSLLAEVGGAVREAVSSAIESEEYEAAVEWTEQGRSIVWQHVLNLRTPVDDLRTTHPELADRFWAISREIQDPIEQDLASDRTENLHPEEVARRRRELSIQWDKLIEEIRRIPNFNSFLRAKSFEELSNIAHSGPVVILNADEARCDALVLTSNQGRRSVINVPLTSLSHKTCVQMFEKLKTMLSRAGVRTRNLRVHEWVAAPSSDGEFKNILAILWRHVAKPVIDSLMYQVNTHDPPHIWWCATGPLAFLPIHAAGLYDEPDLGHKLSDYVVSSYCPTLSSLSEPLHQSDQGDFKMLTVAQPATPNAAPIPQTEDEVKLIRQIASGIQVMNLTGEEATVDRVLHAMQDSNWVHLACHGQQCIGSAMDSGLLLQDGILKLSTVVRARLPKAQFAFLSACQTAMGDESVSEESAHLAAGMLLAGYRGVIATMWSIGDNDAPRIAEDVYQRILQSGKPNWKEAARALHEGVKRLRESGAGFISWVPFIHIGR
ncbi:TPR-like protein [Serendipita vermifera]|nr:TPR-like protein [Serendipita vermifera]